VHDVPASKSEDHGLAALTPSDLTVLSVGISTGGVAEMRMAANRDRHIVATTIDAAGIEFAKERIAAEGFSSQIECKLEDVSQPLPYQDNFFDFVYARLVLHYLSKQDLDAALAELRRVLKPGGKLYVVVRSVDCPDAKRTGNKYDPETNITHVFLTNDKGTQRDASRYFHTQESIRRHVEAAGYTVAYIKQYDERLFIDFMRQKRAPHNDNVIELLAAK
jgi:ubiquinone/menaquinone biosynthesis C-methylase UbiE